MKFNHVVLLSLLALLVAACDSQQPSYSASNANSAPPAPVQEAPPPPPAAAPVEKHAEPATSRPAAPPVSREVVRARPMPTRPEPLPPVDTIGIGGCDDFINRYRTCVNRGVADETIPVAHRSKLVRAFNVEVRQWKADIAAGKTAGLVAACAEADKRARPELVQVGCSSF